VKNDLHRYIAGTIKELDGTPHIVNGTSDHLHLLLGLHQSICVAEAIRNIKANSSKFFTKKTEGITKKFKWQAGYAAFTVSQSKMNKVYQYIENQDQHHQRMSFKEEYKKLLDVNDIDYDEEYVF